MARPMNKKELIEFAENEYKKLFQLISHIKPEEIEKSNIFDNRSTKDLVAHLYAWQLLELTWYKVGMQGKKPAIPAPGYTFKDAPALNEKLFQDYKDIEWETLLKEFQKTHDKLLDIVKSHTEDELYTKKKYAWTGSTDMAVYFRSALSSHYLWANNLIKKHFKIKL